MYEKEVEAVRVAVAALRSEGDPSLMHELEQQQVAAATGLEYYRITKSVLESDQSPHISYRSNLPPLPVRQEKLDLSCQRFSVNINYRQQFIFELRYFGKRMFQDFALQLFYFKKDNKGE